MCVQYRENPVCEGCPRPVCIGTACQPWQEGFLKAWENIRREGVRRRQLARRETLVYGLPHEREDPCLQCRERELCQIPCARRRWWWDQSMRLLKKQLEPGA